MERRIWTDFHPGYLKMDSRYTVDPMRSSDVDSEHGNSTKNNMEGDDITMTQLQRLKRETVLQSSTVQASVNPGFHHPSPKSFPSKLLARRQMLKACHHSGVMVTTNHSPRNWVEHPGVSPGSFSVRVSGVKDQGREASHDDLNVNKEYISSEEHRQSPETNIFLQAT